MQIALTFNLYQVPVAQSMDSVIHWIANFFKRLKNFLKRKNIRCEVSNHWNKILLLKITKFLCRNENINTFFHKLKKCTIQWIKLSKLRATGPCCIDIALSNNIAIHFICKNVLSHINQREQPQTNLTVHGCTIIK